MCSRARIILESCSLRTLACQSEMRYARSFSNNTLSMCLERSTGYPLDVFLVRM